MAARRAPRIIALANQKGGVAKTTSVASLGAAAAELGYRVLLVDLDPQACLTFSLGIDPDAVEGSIHTVLTAGAPIADVVVHAADGVDLVPSTIDLAGAEAVLLARPAREYVIRTALDEVSKDQRRMAKVINFGLIYGMSAFGLASQLNLERAAAQAYIDRYFARYPGVADYMQRTREAARSQGYVETVFGRRLYLPEINAKNGQRRQGAERAAINAPMQGTAADLIKLAMIAVQGWLDSEKLASRLLLQVHDELILEVPERELDRVRGELPGHMCNVAALKVPLRVGVGVGSNWEAAH